MLQLISSAAPAVAARTDQSHYTQHVTRPSAAKQSPAVFFLDTVSVFRKNVRAGQVL
jgi:hypothetical protein